MSIILFESFPKMFCLTYFYPIIFFFFINRVKNTGTNKIKTAIKFFHHIKTFASKIIIVHFILLLTVL